MDDMHHFRFAMQSMHSGHVVCVFYATMGIRLTAHTTHAAMHASALNTVRSR